MFEEDSDDDFLSCGDDYADELSEDLGSIPDIGRAITGAVGRLVSPAPASRPGVRVAPPRAGVSATRSPFAARSSSPAIQNAAHEIASRALAHKMTGGFPDAAHLQMARRTVKVPALDEAVTLLRHAQNQRQATSEHHEIMARAAFKKEVNERLARIESLLGAHGVHIFLGKKGGVK